MRDIQRALLDVFQKWGMPQCIKVDNGRPFADPQRQFVPVLALWLIALGIRVIFNRPRTPQDNAKVERNQGVLSNWTEWQKCKNAFELQCRLWKEADFHNLHYPVQRLEGKTRLEVFPNLLQAPKRFNPLDFDINRVLKFLAKGSWERSVSQNGQLSFWGQRLNVGIQYAHKRISLNLDPIANQWNIYDPNGNLIKVIDTPFTKENLWKLDLS